MIANGKSLTKTRRVLFDATDPVSGKARAHAVATSIAPAKRVPSPGSFRCSK